MSRLSIPGSIALACALPACLAFADGRDAASRSPEETASAQANYATGITSGNQVSMSVTNYGWIGNSFISRSPSLEYPAGLGLEHLTHGGLWVGAHAVDGMGPFTGVTAAALDASLAVGGPSCTEYSPATEFVLRSSLPASPYYSPDALSEEDWICTFDDLTPKSTSYNPEAHRPIGIRVRQQNHAWSASALEDIELFRFTVTNVGANALTDVWVGMYTEFASGDKNAYSCWPPSSGCGPGGWFNKKWLQWDGAWRMIREHYCAGPPVPDGCALETVPYWIGLKLLTPPASGQAVTLAAWNWAPGDPDRDTDVERHAIMSAGTIQDLSAPDLGPPSGDPVELLAIGPWASLAPGDSFEVAFAIVGGAEVADIEAHAEAAQLVHDLNYVPPLAVAAPPARPRLAGAYPNPFTGGELRLAVMLAGNAPARLELLDIGGRRVASRSLDGYGRGGHVVRWSGLPPLAPALYVIRLTQGAATASRLVTVLR